MEVEYVNSNINTLFSDLFDIVDSRNLLQKKIGPILAKKTKMRISHLKSSSTFQKYLAFHIGNPHSLIVYNKVRNLG